MSLKKTGGQALGSTPHAASDRDDTSARGRGGCRRRLGAECRTARGRRGNRSEEPSAASGRTRANQVRCTVSPPNCLPRLASPAPLAPIRTLVPAVSGASHSLADSADRCQCNSHRSEVVSGPCTPVSSSHPAVRVMRDSSLVISLGERCGIDAPNLGPGRRLQGLSGREGFTKKGQRALDCRGLDQMAS